MNKELKKIKKLYGEAMMHFCRDNFALILEIPEVLLNILTSNFHPTHELYKDLEENNLLLKFKEFIYAKLDKNKLEEIEVEESPTELMAKAGYDLYECLTEDDIQKFRKYYTKGEELCTFWTNRLEKARVFFAVKKNVNEIKREDFPNPSRQDEYGTSVISIQFTKDGTNTLSIKNRYNHTVSNPDATFSNDLDNIMPGLTKSFDTYYGLKQKYKNKNFEIPSYVNANDGKYYKYNYEKHNIYYCPDNIIIDNFNVKKYSKEKYLVLDHFILDLEKKKIKLYNFLANDSFIESIGKINKIEIRKEKEEKKVLITPFKGEIIEIGLDKLNRIISYKNNNVKEINDYFLDYNYYLQYLEINNVVKIGSDFLFDNIELKSLIAPNLKEVSNWFLARNKDLLVLDLPNLKYAGITFLECNEKLNELNLPKLEKVEVSFLRFNKALKKLSLPNLKKVGISFLENNENLEQLFLPSLKEANAYFLFKNKKLTFLSLPKLETVDSIFLNNNEKLKVVYLPKLEEIGDNFLNNYNESLKVFIAPKLAMIGNLTPIAFGERYPNLEEFVIAEGNLSLQRKLD